jgi:hypothetical protein
MTDDCGIRIAEFGMKKADAELLSRQPGLLFLKTEH